MANKLTASERKFLQSLHQRKYRYKYSSFLIEGKKTVIEALRSHYEIKNLYLSSNLPELEIKEIIGNNKSKFTLNFIKFSDLESVSTLKNPEGVLAVASITKTTRQLKDISDLPAVYLWKINDPGNLGTIIRTALWFGIDTIFTSPDSVDIYNPKVIRSSMGAIFNTEIIHDVDFADIMEYKNRLKARLYCTHMGGKDTTTVLNNSWITIFGSESHGLPQQILSSADEIIGIPQRGAGESLNLAVSVGIILNELTKY